MPQQKAEHSINPSEEVIQLGQLRVHFLEPMPTDLVGGFHQQGATQERP